MALVTENRIDELLRQKLEHHRISDAVKDVELFATPERILADVVLQDASALEKAREAVQEVERDLGGQGISLTVTVRPFWEVESVERASVANPPGAPTDIVGALFKGILRSGARKQEVWVSVTPSARQVLWPLATNDLAWLNLIRAFLEHWLSTGGAGHWDPVREQGLELGESAARYLRWRPYEQLRGSIDLVFRSLEGSKGLLRPFKELGEPSDFAHALPKLAGPRGAYARGERLPTTNYELYEMLLPSEKAEIAKYYRNRLQRAGEDWPELKKEFASAFAV